MAGAVLGIYGNTAAEALYPSFSTDSTGAPLTGADDYTYRFAPGQLPPVKVARQGTRTQLVARIRGSVRVGVAAVLAETRCAERDLEGSGTGEDVGAFAGFPMILE